MIRHDRLAELGTAFGGLLDGLNFQVPHKEAEPA
jgi:hypothetical protein